VLKSYKLFGENFCSSFKLQIEISTLKKETYGFSEENCGKETTGKPGPKWYDDIKVDLQEIA
jgi:hypothetical protein